MVRAMATTTATDAADTALARAREVLDTEIAGIQKVRDGIGPAFVQTVGRLRECVERNGKIVLTGMGKNFAIARKLAATFTSTGAPAVTLHPAEAMHGDLGLIAAGDVLLVLSYSGASDEVLQLVPLARRAKASVIVLTGAPESPLAELADEVLSVRVDQEACPFNLAPTASTTATLALGDALAMVLLDARGFRREDYARLHPGGAIGRSLLLRASDIMRSGDRLARVGPEASLREALAVMTRAQAGAVVIAEGDGRVAGIFTDGDFRRLMTREEVDLGRAMSDVMTPSPLTVRADDLAMEVLTRFEDRRIDDLPVTDAHGRLVGIIDLQDLPRFKVL